MSTKVTMPQMGESIIEGTITKWLKKVGDSVEQDEPLFEISTDKVDSEIPSPAAGVLSEILVSEGKTVQINTVLAIIDGKGSEVERRVATKVPETPDEVPEREVAVSTPAAEGRKDEASGSSPHVEERFQPSTSGPVVQFRDVRTSPLVRRLAREHNVDLSNVRGTGLEGRITKEDILRYVEERIVPTAAQPMPPTMEATGQRPEIWSAEPPWQSDTPGFETEQSLGPEPGGPGISRFVGDREIVPMTPMRKAIAEHMVTSKRTSAHVSTVFEVDVSSIVQLREQHKAEFERREGITLTFTPFFVKGLVDTVREFPILNSSVLGSDIVIRKPVNVGIAVALETGLIVPVVKDAHLRSFTGLALSIHDLAERARTKKLKPEDVQDGTISMTNPGSFGSLFGTPIINQPQVAIIEVGGIKKRPVVIDDAIAIRSMVYLSLSFDHRVVDGAVADQFMGKLKERMQSWTQWID